ncbi:MAG: UDP-N-acetylglucosamine 2-epimerase (hydrolyzing) [Deltaproteobacteria bacterium]|nr:UDP-N-acetylglucosamine 2-epimerase (hydrolyzing) [Deltaproteobacteria bacterium]
MTRRKICVVTGTRAEYGLLYWLLKEIRQDPALVLQLLVTGMHLAPQFGSTYKEIETDGFIIDERVDMQITGDTPVDIARSMGAGVAGCAEAFARLRPDILVFLGDRYEILAAAEAALVAKIPMAHIHGGEITEGVFDDSIRHSLTKMAHYHFVAAEEYKKRVVQLGEQPARVFNFGALALDNISRQKLLSRDELGPSINYKFRGINFLVTLHPDTLSLVQGGREPVDHLLEALNAFPEAGIIFTQPNADPRNTTITQKMGQYVHLHSHRTILVASLGRVGYLSALKHCDVVIGNSSSGIIEAPMFVKPTVNIGNRQGGRLRTDSIIDCVEESAAIKTAIEKALSAEFKELLCHIKSPYGEAGASKKIKDCLKRLPLQDVLVKKFYNI